MSMVIIPSGFPTRKCERPVHNAVLKSTLRPMIHTPFRRAWDYSPPRIRLHSCVVYTKLSERLSLSHDRIGVRVLNTRDLDSLTVSFT